MGLNVRGSRLRLFFRDLAEWNFETGLNDGTTLDSFGRIWASVRHEHLRGMMEKYVFRSGLTISFMDAYVDQDIEFLVELREPSVGFSLHVEGSGAITYTTDTGRMAELTFLPGLNFASSGGPQKYDLRLLGGCPHRAVRVVLSKDSVPELIPAHETIAAEPLHDILSPFSTRTSVAQQRLSPRLGYLAHQIMRCRLQGLARRLFMESKALEILAYELEEFSGSESGTAEIRGSQDVERLYHARRILETEFADPPTLFQLARRVNLNDFKLKRGFRQLFGETVFAYVRRLRMEAARSLLKETDLSVTQVALEAGYSSFGHFAEAFKTSFGILPSQYRRARPGFPTQVHNDPAPGEARQRGRR